MKKILVILLALTSIFTASAQEKQSKKKTKKEEKRKHIEMIIKQQEEGVLVYKKQKAYGLRLNTDGADVFYEIGRSKSTTKTILYQIELGERKSHKEEKLNSYSNLSIPFIYGKINFLYPLKLGVQQQINLGNKSNKNGLSLSANIGGGLLLGLLRPYEIQVDKAGQRTYIQYNSADSLLFKSAYTGANNPAGPSFNTGWNHLKITPGIYLKPALRFDYGKLNEMVSAIEVGLTLDMYAKKIPQMLYTKEKQLFFGAFVSIIFGKRK